MQVLESKDDVQKEALEITKNNKRCGLAISMGVGKTRIGLQHMMLNYNPLVKYLVVAPKKSIYKSWSDEMIKTDIEKMENHITYTTYISLNKHNPNDYDVIYLDECHSLLLSHELFLSQFKGKILGLTGTPPKRKGTDKYFMVNKYCPIKYGFTVDEASDNKILNQYKIIIHHLQLSQVPNLIKKTNDGRTWYTNEKKDYDYSSKKVNESSTFKTKQFNSIMRMKSMMDYSTKEDYVMSMLKHMNQKCIIFANTQKQADKICKHSYHSSNKNSENNLKLFSDGTINKLSCVLQLNEGVSIPDLKQGIIMHAYGNERKTSQRIGRLLRLNPKDTATCHILCYKDTIDEKWVTDALSALDQSKIEFYNPLIN
jgi:superfamily II DNA or RNA helicase